MCKLPPASILAPPKTFLPANLFQGAPHLQAKDKEAAKNALLQIQLLLARRTS